MIGQCALCLEERELCDSHYMPAALYQIVGGAPVVVTDTATIETGKQLSARLLCLECEQRFHENGEDWVLRHCVRPTEARLHQKLQAAEPLGGGHHKVEGVDWQKLAYFAASIFWRGTACEWRSVAKGGGSLRIDLGRITEPLRRYLLGEAEFPEDAALLVWVTVRLPLVTAFTVPKMAGHYERVDTYQFLIPGLMFQLMVANTDEGLPAEWREQCLVRGPGNVLRRSEAIDAELLKAFRKRAISVPDRRKKRRSK